MTTYSVKSPVAREDRAEGQSRAAPDRTWVALYQLSGVAALTAVVLIMAAVIVFLVSPPPTNVADHFALLQRNPLLGLLDLDLLMVTTYAVLIVFYLGLYRVLQAECPSLMTIALALNLVSIAVYITTNPALAMLSLSGQYTGSATAGQRSALLAAGEAVYANSVGTAFDVSYVMGGIAVIIIAVVMLRSGKFGKATAYMGLAMGALMLIPATAGTLGLYLSLVSLLPTVIWLVLVGRRLLVYAHVL